MSTSLNKKIAQMCIIGINNKEDIEPVKRLIKKYAIGGVFLYKRAYDDYNEMRKLIKALKDSNKDNIYPLFIMVHQECGNKSILPNRFSRIISIKKIIKANNLKYAYKAGLYIGKIFCKTGININISSLNKNKYYKYELEYLNGIKENIMAIPKCSVKNMDSNIGTIMIKNPFRKRVANKKVITITEDIDALKRKIIFGKRKIIKKSFLNGYDIVMCSYYPGISKDMIMNTNKQLNKKLINKSFKKIIHLKEKMGIDDKTTFKGININIINYKIDILNKEIDELLGE